MTLETDSMSELSEINRKIDIVIEGVSNLKTGQAVADQHIEGLRSWCGRLDTRVESLSREMRSLEQQNQRVDLLKRDIDQVGEMVRSLEEDLKPTIEAALNAALAPFRRTQDQQGFWWKTVSVVGRGWWAALLIILGAVARDVFGK